MTILERSRYRKCTKVRKVFKSLLHFTLMSTKMNNLALYLLIEAGFLMT